MNNRSLFISRSLVRGGLVAFCRLASAGPYPFAPLYNPAPPAVQPNPGIYYSSVGAINLASVPPATNVPSARQAFDQRAAAAIFQAAGVPFSSDNSDNGEGYQSTLAAKYAYAEFFPDDVQGTHRNDANSAILAHSAGQEGTDISSGSHDEYDFCLNYYLPVLYRYYPAMPANVSDYLINHLLNDATRAGIPTGRSGVGPLEDPWSEFIHVPDVIDVPETENHLLMIESSRYLFNQLFHDIKAEDQYDNNKNGLTGWLHGFLQQSAMHDFMEFSARPYARFTLHVLLNLYEFARDEPLRDAMHARTIDFHQACHGCSPSV